MVEGEKQRGAEKESDLRIRERMYGVMMKEKVGRIKQYQGIFTARHAKLKRTR